MMGFYRSAIRSFTLRAKGVFVNSVRAIGVTAARSMGYDGPSGFYSSFRGMARWPVLDLVRTEMHG
jgi:hypothetical protein